MPPEVFDWPKLVLAVGVPLALISFAVVYFLKVLLPQAWKDRREEQEKDREEQRAERATARADFLNALAAREAAETARQAQQFEVFERRLTEHSASCSSLVGTIVQSHQRELKLIGDDISGDLKALKNAVIEHSNLLVSAVPELMQRRGDEPAEGLEKRSARGLLQVRQGKE